ncbi:hypothetical protein ABB55_08515 [Prosthecomicrobium hirschii]|uniref:Uncharacterized protein n=1 Tax=Prosthecodimorpha hirschii TaxID=665126 RepID=A0A0P6VPC0_9HYPH|nr:hypothetical protein ABB55_08515 [Prosthecomicrobium hirschii]
MTDLTDSQIRHGVNNGTLPLPVRSSNDSHYRRYSVADAIACLAADALVGRHLGAETVTSLIYENFDHLQKVARVYQDASVPGYFAIVRVGWTDGTRRLERLAVAIGPAADLRVVSRHGLVPIGDIDGDMIAIAATNITSLVSGLRQRAAKLGIGFEIGAV